jgi:hypothetical protein
MISAEIINWTGRILSFPRGLLPEALKRKEVAKTGVYFLIGPDPNNPLERMVYVGKSDDVAQRLRQHDGDDDKDFFEHVALFVSKDENLTTGHAGYLENRLISIIRSLGLAHLANGNSGSVVTLPESEVSDMEYVLQQLRVLMPALGFTFLQELPKPVAQSSKSEAHADPVMFELSYLNGSIKAQAYEAEGQLVVLKGSTARHRSKATPSMRTGYFRQIDELIKQKKLVLAAGSSNLLMFTEDVGFSSPSAASDIICGASTNGKIVWKVRGSDETYGEWRARRMQADCVTPTADNGNLE